MEEQRQLIYEILLSVGNSPDQAKKVAVEIDNITRSANQATKATDDLSKAAKANAKLQQDMGRASGLAGAAAFELGRTISDLPFGINAITNNISQLGTLMAALVANTGGVRKAFSALLGQLVGPAGVLIAFQTVVALVQTFAGNTKKATEQIDDLTKSLFNQRIELELLRKALDNQNLTEEQRADILERYKTQFKELAEATRLGLIDKEKEREILGDINGLITKRQEIARLDAKNVQKNADIAAELEKAEQRRLDLIKAQDEERRRRGPQLTLDQTLQMELKFKKEISYYDGIIEKLTQRSLAHNEESNKLRDEARQTEQEINQELQSILQKRDEETEKKKEQLRIDQDRLKALDELSKAEMDLQEKILDDELDALKALGVQRVQERRKIIKKLHQLELDRLEQQKKEELRNVNDPQTIKAIKDKFNLLAKSAGIDFRNELEKVVLEPIKVKVRGIVTYDDMLSRRETPSQKAARERVEKSAQAAVDDLMKRENDKKKVLDKLRKEEVTFEDSLKITQEGLDAAFSLIDSAYERELALEERKTIALNDQLRARLRNEKLTADQRDAINQQIAKNDAELLKKQNIIEEKRFKLNKAANISNAIINTALAITKALDFAFPGSLVAASVVGAAGLAQIQAIANQTFVPKESPSVNLSSQGLGETNAPSFNVVGGSIQNQIAAAVAGVMSEPVRAYVVASDVTTAQQLERNIIEGASI